MTWCAREADSTPAGSVWLRAGEDWARPWSCFQLLGSWVSAAVVEADRILFLEPVCGWSGTLKLPLVGREDRW